MKTLKTIVGCGLTAALCGFALAAQAAEKSVKWSLPGDWESGAECAGMVRGLGEVGAPDLPAFRYTVTMPKGAKLTGVTFDAAWKEVEGVPSPVAAPVTSGQKLVYPEPGPQFAEVYPASAAYALEAMISGNKILQPIVITPYKWDGTTKTLYRATKLDVTITYTEPRTLKLTTSSVNETEGEVLILSPHDFVSLWQGYAAFRKSTDAGKNFTFTVKDAKEIYDYPGLTDREKTDYALALHHYIETNFYKAASCDKQYVILGASPAKTATFNPNTMIPKRDFFGDSGTSPHDYDQAGDMYYGCMERLKNGAIDPSVEVWDYGNDGVYWAAQNTSPYNFDPDNCVDWTMEIAVTRVPLLERSVETLPNGNTIEKTAAQMMDAFTNRIAWAESAAFETADRGKAYVGGNENEGNQKGGKDERYTGERTFFDGIANMFDPSRNGKITSDEWGPRDRAYNIMGKVQPQRDAKIIACNISNANLDQAYANRGDLATFYSHGDWREYGNLSASRAYQGGGFYAVYATSFSCMSGKYDTNGDGAGITNALCFGEAPIVAPVKEDGALVTLTSARDGWSGGFGTLSMWLDELFLKALYGLADGVPMNAAQAGKYAHNTYAASAKGTTSAHGSVLGHAILCGDPLIKVFMMPNRTELTGYSRNLSVSTASSKTFNIEDDVAAARAAFSDAGNQTLTLEGAGKFRTTDTLTVTNVANLVWSVAGGAGRNGITFSGTKGNLTLGGTATRYFGPKLTNVGEISVTGGNVTLDFDTTACSFDELTYINSEQIYTQDDVTANPNILRTRKEGFVPAAQTIPVVNSALKLQTINIGGNTTALKDTPLFYVTNGVLTVESNPYWGTEYFVRPTYLSNAKILGEYVDFGLGRPDSNGYDLYVDGTSEIGGSTPIKVTGELRLHLEDAATTLTITNALANGHNGAAGSVVVSGAGKVVLATSPTLTGGVTIEGGIALELPKIPLTSGGTITLESGAKLLLPEPSSSGIYNVYSGDAKLVLGDGVKVYKASAPETEIKGRFVNGNFVPDDAVIYWKAASGTWQDSASVTTCWTNSSGQAVGFTNGQSVFFGPVASAASVSVTASSVSTDYAEVNAPGWNYTFSGTASPTLLTIVSAAYMDNTSTINARKVEVVEGASFHMHKQSRLNGIGNRTVKALTFSFSAARSSDQRVAIQELRLFQDTTFFPMPTGTIIEDCAGNKIRITGYTGDTNKSHTYEWIKGTDGNESLRALIDGVLGNANKWWASSSAAPTWFTITFPSAQSAITGYNLRTADSAGRNPKSWTVSVSDDGLAYTKERAQSGVDFSSTGSWMGNDGTAKAYDLMADLRGVLHVQKGGTLVSEGNARVDVTFDEGAILKLVGGAVSLFRPNDSTYCFLNLPENGGVYVSAEGLSASSGNEVLYGYSLTDADVAKFTPADNVTLSLSGGNLYATVDNKKCGPFKTTLTTGTGATPSWTTLAWKDRYGGSITWDSSLQYSASATAALNVESLPSGGATLNLNYAATFGTLKLTGGSTETLTLSWSAACVPAKIDLTEYDGKVILAPGSNLTSATEIIANENTEINGTGIAAKLTIGADKKATVEYPWSGTKTVATGGTIAYDNNTSSSAIALGTLKIDGAKVVLAGTHLISGEFAAGAANTGIEIADGATVTTISNDAEMKLANNANSHFEVSGGTLTLQNRVRIQQNTTGRLVLSGGEIASSSTGFLYPGGGYGGGSMDLSITGGRFTACYNPYNAQIACNAQVNISGGEFAPANLWYTSNGNKPSSDNTSTTLNNSGFAVNMWGGTFSTPAGVPNWLPINVTAGSANLGPQNAGTTTIRSLLTIDGGATLNITAGTISFAGSGALKGAGTLAIGSGATFTTAYGSLSNNVTVAAGGTLNLTGAALTESGITITAGTFSKADDATLQINGTALDMTQWTIEGNRIVKRQSGQYGPLMSERWHQHNPFNWFAAYVGGDLTPCGCVAMGVGQMFHYYRWPVRTDTVTEAATTYQTGGVVTPFPLAVDGKDPFLWDEMRDYASACTLTGQYEAARMILWCDALAKMCFQPGGSNTALYYVPESVSYWYEKGEELLPSAGDHRERLKTELAAGRPIQTTIDGHQVVIDGWRSSDNKFHVNWGQEDSDPGKTTWFDVTQSTLGSWSVSSFWVGITPRKMAQIQTLPKLGSSTVTLAWDVPAVHTNSITGFTVKDYTCADAVTDYTIPGTNELSYTRADYYPIPGVYGATENATFACTVHSSNTKALIAEVQVRYDGGPWQTFATPKLSTEESYWEEKTGKWIDKTIATNILLNLSAKAGKAAEFRIKTTRTGNSFAAEHTGPYLRLYKCAWTNVHAPVTAVEHAAGAAARSLEISGLTAGTYHSFTVTPTIEGAVESEPMGMRVAAASQDIPALPDILRVETMGSPITDGFVREVKPGAMVFFVKGSETVTGVSAAISHQGLVATNLVRVKSIPQGNWYAIEIDASEQITVNSRMILTIEATDAYENRVVKDLMLIVSNTIEDDNDGQLMSALDQENAVIVPPDVTNHLESTFDQPLVGAGTVIFNNTLPEGYTLINSLQNSFAWHGTVRMVDCPAVQYPDLYKNENSFLVEEKSPEPPGPTPEPDPNEMYHNTLCASNEEVKVARGTYGTAIEVPTNGYYATAFNALTKLETTASASIGGNYADIIKNGTYIDTHTVVGWFKVGALPTGSNLATLYLAKSCDQAQNGYKVAVDASGKILVGKISYDSGKYSWYGSNYKTTSSVVVTADTWFHLAIAITKTDGAKTVTPAVFVNGQSVDIASGTFEGNLNGNSCTDLMVGAGVTASGVYVDTTALSDAAKVASFATNAYYVVKGAQPMPEPIEPLSQKYYNQLAGDAVVPAKTYGTIVVPDNGYMATALTGKTELSTSGTGIGGNFNGLFQSGVDVASHTIAGWFKVDQLPSSGSYTLLWSVRNDQTSYGGYGAVVGSDGKIYVGRTANDNSPTPTLENYNAKSSEAVITAGEWCYLMLSFEKSSSARTATVKVYKNGGSEISFDATSNTGCNGGTTTSKFYVGAAGVSVAGFYIDNTILSWPATMRYLATSSTYLKPYDPTPTNAAKIGDTEYATVAAAIEAVTTGQTITLLKNCSEDSLSAGDKTFTLDLAGYSLTGTLTIGASGAVTLPTLPAANTLKIAGSGRLVYNNATIPTLNNIWDSTWTGTFAYSGCNTSQTGWDLTSYYNGTASKFEFGGTLTGGYFRSTEFSLGELVLTGSITFTDGYTSAKAGDPTNNYRFKALSGSGTLNMATTTTCAPGIKIADISRFTGTVHNTCSKGSVGANGYRLIFGDGDLVADGNNLAKAAIHFTGNAALNSLTMDPANGIFIHNPASVGGTATLASATTFEDGAEITTTNGVLTATGTLTFDATTKVRVAAAPAGDVKIINKSGTTAGEIDTTVSVYVGTSETPEAREYKLAYKTDGVYLVPGESPYAKFDYGIVYSWLTTGSSVVCMSSGDSSYQVFDIVGGTNKTDTTYHGNTTYSGQAFWKQFAHATGISTTYAAPGEILRLAQGSYLTSIGATWGPLTFGGIIAEAGDTGYTFVDKSSGNRSNLLGDPSNTTPTFFDIGANVTFDRTGKLYLAGTLTFDIASGKTFNLNSAKTSQELALFATVEAAGSGAFGTTTAGGTLIMKGEGTLQVNNLKALGSTLDYRNLPYDRETAYISGTLTINDATVIKLPEGLAENTPFKMATTLSGANNGERTIWIGEEEVEKYVTFDLANGTITYADAIPYKTLGWNGSAWTNAEGVVTAVDNTCILNAKAGDVITFASAVTPHEFNMPESGTVTLGTGGNLMNYAITVPSGATLALGWNSSDAYSQVISGAGAVDITGAMVQLSANNAFTGALTVQKDATLMMGANNCLNNSNEATVNAGGTLDINGKRDNGNIAITLNGGKLANSGSAVGGAAAMKSLTLTADSEIDIENEWSLTAGNYAASTLALGGHTLTKKGAAEFLLINTTVTGSGTLAINEGTIRVRAHGNNWTTVTCAEATFELNGGALTVDSGKTLSLANLTVNSGAISNSGTITGLANLVGTIDFATAGGTISFAESVTVGKAGTDGTVTMGNANLTTASVKLLTGTLNLAKIGQRTLKSLTPNSGTAIIVSTNATEAAVAITNGALDLQGVTLELAGVLPAEGGTIKLISASGGISNYEKSFSGRGDWKGNYADNTLSATKAKATYVAPGEGGVVTDAGNNADSLDISMDLAKKATKDMEKKVTDDSSSAEVVEALNQTGKNTYKVWESAVLGLDPNDATSQLVISPMPVQGSDPTKVTLKVPTVNVDTTTGADVTFCFWSKTGDNEWTEVPGGVVGSGTEKELDLPSEGVRYFQLRTTIKTSVQASIPTVIPSANIVAAGMPVTTGTGSAKVAASLGTKTLDAAADHLVVELAGAAVYEGQEYHLEVTEPTNADANHFAIVAKADANKSVTFNFGKNVPAGTTCKLTMITEQGNGNVVLKTEGFTGVDAVNKNVIVATRVGWLPFNDGLATAQAPAMPQQFRIPAIATDGEGEVIACYDCRYGKSDLGARWDSGNGDGNVFSGIDIAENYSNNSGVSFDSPTLGVDVPNMRDQTGAWIGGYANRNNANYINKTNDLGDVTLLYDPHTQKYWMMGITGGGLTTTGTNTDKADVVLYTRERGKDSKWVEWNNGKGSTDKMEYRSVKQQIIDSLGKQPTELNKGFLEGPGHGIVTTHDKMVRGETAPAGTLVFPIQCFFSDGTHAGAAYSTDHGATWKATPLCDTNTSPQENCIMELDDGTWYMCTKCCASGSAGEYRCYTYDHENNTWTRRDGAPCPNAREGSCLRMGVDKNGVGQYAICHARNDRANIVVYFGVDTTSSSDPTEKAKGISWDWTKYITIHKENTSGGYSSMCMVDGTTLGILYETNYGASSDGGTDTSGCRMYFTRIDVSDKVVPPTK